MSKPRARELGVPFEGMPGQYNAITDVAGVTVGHATLIAGEGPLEVGRGPVRTGVTAILPRGDDPEPVFASWYSLNGCGEMTGAIWLEEVGLLTGPIMITNTLAVGTVADAVSQWWHHKPRPGFVLPVVAETYDGGLNDIRGGHVRAEHAWASLDAAAGGPVAEGNVGGGTGMRCHGFKGGIGTASRVLSAEDGGFTVGVLVQANQGRRKNLTIAGVPIGREIEDQDSTFTSADGFVMTSSIIVVVATDCPLLPHQLDRIAKRVSIGVGRVGGMGEHTSGDIFLALSTAALGPEEPGGIHRVAMFLSNRMNPLFEATVQATEEAIVNALVAAETMTGINGNTVYALPTDRLREVLRKYNRLAE
jgi:D-aminopeptidase